MLSPARPTPAPLRLLRLLLLASAAAVVANGTDANGTAAQGAPGLEGSFWDPRVAPSRSLTADEVEHYNREGYVIVRGMFAPEEVDVLREAVETDPAIASNTMPMADSTGRTSKLTLWNVAGDDTYGYFARGARWAHASRALINDPKGTYHFHTKVMLKEPWTGGAWEWHQDFGYWYQQGCLEPDSMFSSILAVDDHTIDNGCMQLLARTHRLGRIAHGVTGEQAGADPELMEEIMARNKSFPLVHALLKAGDVLFTHSNLLHASRPNNSPHWRRSLIVAFNGASNPPRVGTHSLPHESPIEPLFEDGVILGEGGLKLQGAGGRFASHEKNVGTFAKGAN